MTVSSRKTRSSLLIALMGAIGTLVLEHTIRWLYLGSPFTTSGYRHIYRLPEAITNEATIFRFDGLRFVHLTGVCKWTSSMTCTSLKTGHGDTPIHIHNLEDDGLVSGTLLRTGRWEVDNMELIYHELKKDPELGFMDLGSHVGAFSLSVAKLGRQVVSVDPLIENVQRLCKSVQMGGLTKDVTIIFNPLSNKHRLVEFKREAMNVGGTTIFEVNENHHRKNVCENPVQSYTVTLDDLLQFLPFSKTVIKMDIQQSEYAALSGARRFFERIEVPAILMEWELMKIDKYGKQLVDLLTDYNYTAYEPRVGGQVLDPKQYQTWPYDVMWRKV